MMRSSHLGANKPPGETSTISGGPTSEGPGRCSPCPGRSLGICHAIGVEEGHGKDGTHGGLELRWLVRSVALALERVGPTRIV
jgi:hypothetical protein